MAKKTSTRRVNPTFKIKRSRRDRWIRTFASSTSVFRCKYCHVNFACEYYLGKHVKHKVCRSKRKKVSLIGAIEYIGNDYNFDTDVFDTIPLHVYETTKGTIYTYICINIHFSVIFTHITVIHINNCTFYTKTCLLHIKCHA